jgi:hypothetical protein
METATHAAMEASASTTMETAAPTAVEAAAPTAVEATAAATSATARLGYVCEHQPYNRAREDRGERQRNLLAARSSQHGFLHLN